MKIFVGNLHHNASEAMLYDLFGHYGEVQKVTVAIDASGKPEGYGYVEMKDAVDAQKAIKQLNKINFMNQFLEVNEIGKPKQKQ